MVFKCDIEAVLQARFYYLLRTLCDSDPQFCEQYQQLPKTQRWLPVSLAEVVVLKWVDNPHAWVKFLASPAPKSS